MPFPSHCFRFQSNVRFFVVNRMIIKQVIQHRSTHERGIPYFSGGGNAPKHVLGEFPTMSSVLCRHPNHQHGFILVQRPSKPDAGPDPFQWSLPADFDPLQRGSDGLMKAQVYFVCYKASNPIIHKCFRLDSRPGSEGPRVRKSPHETSSFWSILIDITESSRKLEDKTSVYIGCGLELYLNDGKPLIFKSQETKIHSDLAQIIHVGHISNIASHNPQIWAAELKKSALELVENKFLPISAPAFSLNHLFTKTLLEHWGLSLPDGFQPDPISAGVVLLDRQTLQAAVRKSRAELELLQIDYSPITSDDSSASQSSDSA